MSLQEANRHLSMQCIDIVARGLPPPPYHSASFFVDITKIARRALPSERCEYMIISWWQVGRWAAILFSFGGFQGSFMIRKGKIDVGEDHLADIISPPGTIQVQRSPGPMLLLFFWLRGSLRCISVLLMWLVPAPKILQAIVRAIGMSYWVILQGLWLVNLWNDRENQIYTTQTIAYWAVLGHYSSLVSDDYSTIAGLLLRVASFFCSVCFVDTLRGQWPTSLRWSSVRRLAKGNEFSVGPAMTGILLTWLSGLAFFRDGTMGCSVVGVQGFWVPWGQKEVPMLQAMHAPITLVFLLWAISACIDDYRHGRGSFKYPEKST